MANSNLFNIDRTDIEDVLGRSLTDKEANDITVFINKSDPFSWHENLTAIIEDLDIEADDNDEFETETEAKTDFFVVDRSDLSNVLNREATDEEFNMVKEYIKKNGFPEWHENLEILLDLI